MNDVIPDLNSSCIFPKTLETMLNGKFDGNSVNL